MNAVNYFISGAIARNRYFASGANEQLLCLYLTMSAYRHSLLICSKLYLEYEATGKGLSTKTLFLETLTCFPGEEGPFDVDTDVLFSESLRYAMSEERIVALDDGTYILAEAVREDMAPREKGVICTNDDHTRCEICAASPIMPQLDTVDVLPCCGHRICKSCYDNGKDIATNLAGERSCSVCGYVSPAQNGERKRHVRRLARRVPWAAMVIGTAKYDSGDYVAGTSYDAVRYLRKAASAGNPEALFHLGRHLLDGTGCLQNIPDALVCFERCLTIDVGYMDCVFLSASNAIEGQNFALAEQVLENLAAKGQAFSQYLLGMLYEDPSVPLGSEMDGKCWQVLSALNGNNCIFYMARKFLYLKKLPQARLFLQLDAGPSDNGDSCICKDYEDLRNTLREAKEHCGWCGVSLPTKRDRKTCRQCRAVCYCSRSCQKYHWNCRRLETSHRNDCKDVAMLKADILKSAQA